MIKRSFTIIIAALLIVVCAFAFAGCDDFYYGNTQTNGKKEAPTVSVPDSGRETPTEGVADGEREDKVFVTDENALLSLDDEGLIALYKKVYKCPEEYLPLLSYKLNIRINSADDEQAALETAKARVTNKRSDDEESVAQSAEIALDTPLYWVVSVSWKEVGRNRTSDYTGNTICYKNSAVEFNPPIYSKENFAMTVKDPSNIREAIDVYEYMSISQIGGYYLLLSKVEKAEEGYTYYNYMFGTCYGDYGIKDEVTLIKRTYNISDAGAVSFPNEEILKTVYIEGNGYNYGGSK